MGPARARSAAELQESARLVSPCPGVLSALCKQGVRWHAKSRTRMEGVITGPGRQAAKGAGWEGQGGFQDAPGTVGKFARRPAGSAYF